MAIQRFVCLNCHQRFQADDTKMVECPHCHSDNVEPESPKKSKIVWMVSAAIIIIGLLSYLLLRDKGVREIGKDPITTFNKDSDSIIIDVPKEIVIPPKIEYSPLNYDGKAYSFSTIVGNAPQQHYRIVLTVHRDSKKIIARSEDGKFKGIPPSEAEGGQYDLVILDDRDSMLCEPTPVSGFIKRENITQKMSKEQLQELINNGDESLMGDGENNYLAPSLSLICKGLPSDAQKPESLYDVVERLQNGLWSSVTILRVDYDKDDRISTVEISIEK